MPSPCLASATAVGAIGVGQALVHGVKGPFETRLTECGRAPYGRNMHATDPAALIWFRAPTPRICSISSIPSNGLCRSRASARRREAANLSSAGNDYKDARGYDRDIAWPLAARIVAGTGRISPGTVQVSARRASTPLSRGAAAGGGGAGG